MAQGIVNLNDIVKALEKDAQTLSTIVDVCKAIGDIPVVGADIEKTQKSAQFKALPLPLRKHLSV